MRDLLIALRLLTRRAGRPLLAVPHHEEPAGESNHAAVYRIEAEMGNEAVPVARGVGGLEDLRSCHVAGSPG